MSKYLEGIARYLSQYRVRESLTQNEMAQRLDLSLNRYREYEQNTTDNAKGIALDLLIKISELEGRGLSEFMALFERPNSDASSLTKIDALSAGFSQLFELVPLEERRQILDLMLPHPDQPAEILIPSRMKWWVKLGILLFRMHYDVRIKFEREILEEYIKTTSFSQTQEQEPLLDRLRELVKYYFTHFDSYKR